MIERGRRVPGGRTARVSLGLLGWAVRIAVPLACASVILRAFPRHVTVDGVAFTMQVTLFSRAGISADTTLGSWQFPHFDGLPVGVHISPVDVDVLRLTRNASSDTPTFVNQLRGDFLDRVPTMAAWLLAEAVAGLAIGVLLVVAGSMAIRSLRGRPTRLRRPTRRGVLIRAGAAVAGVLLVVGYGVITYNPNWAKQSRLTGTLAALQLFPAQLKDYYAHQSKAYDALGAVIGIQAALQRQIERADTPATAYNVMFISDVHLAAVYPLVRQYATNFDVKLIVNTGDESEFGSGAELTPAYTAAIAAVTRTVPMIWLAGNHDSPEVATIMRGIPGVTVLGTKTRAADGSVSVGATTVQAGGLDIAGLPDPRVYGGVGIYGSDDNIAVDQLERASVDSAVETVGADSHFDIFATHEPVAAAEAAARLAGRVRQTVSGHVHAQNSTGQIQGGSYINLVEGSTGAGGLDNIDRGQTRPPVEFSIESVAADCQFTKVTRFQLNNSAAATDPHPSFGDDVSVSTLYLKVQTTVGARACAAPVRVGQPREIQ